MLLSAIVSRGVFEKQSAETSRSSRTAVRSFCKPGARSSTPPGRPLKQKYAVPSSKQPAQTAGEDPIVEGDSFIARFGRKLVVTALVVYKGGISPLLPSFCKFYPTCSVYAMEAVERHGVSRGLWLAAKRVLRCRPFSPGGHDAVPDA